MGFAGNVRNRRRPASFDGVPRGYLAVKVGKWEEERRRFVIPVMYVNHPLFVELLKVAEEEFGFDQKGLITIPCHVDVFLNVQGLIDKELHLHDHHHQHQLLCFRV